MKNRIGLLIAIIFLGYGLIRIGVGGALLAQTSDIISISNLAEATSEVEQFIDTRLNKQIVTFTTGRYFIYIIVMGVFLTIGAIGAISRTKWGFISLWFYIAMHAALFINFQEVNRKLFVLALQIILLLALIYLRPANSTKLKSITEV